MTPRGKPKVELRISLYNLKCKDERLRNQKIEIICYIATLILNLRRDKIFDF
jgi:hypothetical protein